MGDTNYQPISNVIKTANTGLDAIKRAPIVDYDTGIKCLRIQDVSQYKEYEDWGFTQVEQRNYDKFQLRKNDIIVARTGASIGVNKIIKYDLSSVFNNGLIRIRVQDDKCTPEYLYYNFQSANYDGFIDSISGGTSTQPNMQINSLLSYEINVSPLPEQKAITAVLSSLDDKIDLLHCQNNTLEAIAETLFRQWFVDGKNAKPYLFEELVDSVSVKHSFNRDKVIFLNTSDVFNGKVLQHEYSDVDGLPGQAKKSIQKDDILFTEIRPANRRFAYINFEADDYVVSTKLMVLRSKNVLDTSILYLFLRRQETLDYLQMLAEARSGTFPQITFDHLKTLEIFIPKDEVVLIDVTKVFQDIIQKTFKNHSQINTLEKLRDTLLPKLVSGEIKVDLS